MIQNNLITLKLFIEHIKIVSNKVMNLERHKRRLAEAISKIQDYVECFKLIDLDKKGVIYPKVLQNYLIKHKYYFQPTSINRFYNHYAHQKSYLAYEDILEALMPHTDFILVNNIISNSSNYYELFDKKGCKKQKIQTISHFTSFVISEQIKCLKEDYKDMRNVTKNSQRIGAILWRLLDKNHTNLLNYQKLKTTAQQVGTKIQQYEWKTFLYWHFHSYKTSINRDHFLKIVDIQQTRKRAFSACKMEQFKIQSQLFKSAEQDRLKNERIKKAVQQKLMMMPHINVFQYKNIVRQEHFPFGYLNERKLLSGKPGYSNAKNVIKSVIQIQK